MRRDQNIIDLCRYRLQQADEPLAEAKILLDSGYFRGTLNRAYYAMFYALQISVIAGNQIFLKHSGAISYFDGEYVKTGIVDKKFTKWLHRLFDLRQDADYGDMFFPSEDVCVQAVGEANEFV